MANPSNRTPAQRNAIRARRYARAIVTAHKHSDRIDLLMCCTGGLLALLALVTQAIMGT